VHTGSGTNTTGHSTGVAEELSGTTMETLLGIWWMWGAGNMETKTFVDEFVIGFGIFGGLFYRIGMDPEQMLFNGIIKFLEILSRLLPY
jgi:hypothetical protein